MLLEQLKTRKSQQVVLLLALYARRKEEPIDPLQLGEQVGIPRLEAARATRYCEEEGLLERHASDSTRVAITATGAAMVEAAIASPAVATEHFPPLGTLTIPEHLVPKVEKSRRPSRAA